MPTYVALTTLPDEGPATALGEAMEALRPCPTGVGVFEVEDGSGLWEVGGYFTERPDRAGLALLEAMHGAAAFAVSKLEDRDWVAQVRRELSPVRAGRFVVYGSHDHGAAGPSEIGLEIDAAMAFGTGHHGTTQGCLLSLDHLIRLGLSARNVADIGAGTGVLVMGAAVVWPKARVIASDIDQVATDTASANMRWNGLGRIQCVTSAGFRHPALHVRGPYDLIFANILAGPLCRLAPQMAEHTDAGSRIILSGILNRQAARVESVYSGWGFVRERQIRIGEWTTFTFRRM